MRSKCFSSMSLLFNSPLLLMSDHLWYKNTTQLLTQGILTPLFYIFADNVRPKTPPVSISDIKKVRVLKSQRLRSLKCSNHLNRTYGRVIQWDAFFWALCVTSSHLRKKRRRCQRVPECPSSWATLSTRQPSTRRTWGKRWSSWCWIRRTACPLLMVGFIRVSIDFFCCKRSAVLLRHDEFTQIITSSFPLQYSRGLSRLGEGAAAGAPGVRGGDRVRQQRRPVGSRNREDAPGWRKLDNHLLVCRLYRQWSGPEWMTSEQWCTRGLTLHILDSNPLTQCPVCLLSCKLSPCTWWRCRYGNSESLLPLLEAGVLVKCYF